MNWFNLHNMIFMAPAEGDPTGAPGNNPAPDLTVLQKQVADLTASNQKLESKKNEILEESKKARDQLKAWEGLDPENIRGLLARFEGDEELKLIAQGKHDEVIKKRTEKISAEYGGKLKTLEEERNTYKSTAEKQSEKIRDLLIDSDLAQVFLAEEGHKSALADLKFRARQVWKLEGDDVVPRNEKGEIIPGKNGIMTKEEWINKLKEEAPHLFPPSTGANATGANNSRRSTGNIDLKLEAARKAGDTGEMRRLNNLKKQGKVNV